MIFGVVQTNRQGVQVIARMVDVRVVFGLDEYNCDK